MRRFSVFAIAALWAATTSASAQAPLPPPSKPLVPLEAYGQLPSLEEVRISPKGDLLAYVATSGDDRILVVERLADLKPVKTIKVSKVKVRGLAWADDTRLLVTTSTTTQVENLEGPKHEWYQVTCLDLATGKQWMLMDGAQNAINAVYGEPLVRVIDGKTFAFVQALYFAGRLGAVSLFRIDLATGRREMVGPGEYDTGEWFVDNAGLPAAETRYNPQSGHWSLRIHKPSGSWMVSQVIDAPIDVPSIVGYAKDGRSLLVHTMEAGQPKLHAVSLTDGSWGPAEPDPYDEFLFDRASHLLGGVDLEGDQRLVTLFDPRLAAIWKGVEKAISGSSVRLASWTDDHQKLVVVVDGAHDGYGYVLVDIDKASASWIGDIYDKLPADVIAQPQPLSYKAADGLEISAYLTLPLGRDPKNLPLIVMPHGGPADRDTLDFDWLREALVSRGYAVLQPNFRGSSGYTDDFLEAGYGQWGRKMQTDLSDGVRRVSATGVVDPKRVCIFGWSYGGYAALAGAALDHGVYRCAADMAGPSDLKLMLRQAKEEDSKDVSRYWTRYMGVTGPEDPALKQISPAAKAAEVDIPVLIVHGKDDTVVSYRQSETMAAALKAAGKPYTFVTLDGEDHWGSRSETRLKLLQAVMAFMIKNTPPDPPL